MRKLICVITLCIMMITIFSGCGVLEKLGLKDSENDELYPVSSIVMSEGEAKKLSDKVPVRLYFADENSKKLLAEIRYIPMSEAKKSVNNLASVIVKELIKGPKNTRLKATIPKGTDLRSPVSINAGIATVDLTKQFVDNHPGGKEAEETTIYSIVNSLTELKEIQKVRFVIDGKERKEYKGHFQFNAPFPRNTSIISKEPPVKSTMTNEEPEEVSKKPEEKENNEDNKDDNSTQETFEDLGEFDETSEETYIEILE